MFAKIFVMSQRAVHNQTELKWSVLNGADSVRLLQVV